MPDRIKKLLLDVHIACSEIQNFTNDRSFGDYQMDRMLQLAIEREFEIIGEALRRLEKLDEGNLRQKIPEYRKIIDFRNILAHGYDIVDHAALWDFAVNLVPDLIKKIEDYLAHR
jgi:uncharacterized protein with HEPN domain